MVHNAYPHTDACAPITFRIKNRFSRWLFKRQEARRVRGAQLVIANSEKTRKDILDATHISQEHVAVSYLGCDSESLRPVTSKERTVIRMRLGLNQNDPVLGFVGALGYDRNKGFDVLLRACAKIKRESNVRPVIVAAGTGQLNFWRQQIAALDLNENVRLLGLVEFVPDMLAAVDVFVSPTRYDAYGLAVHEALCRGIPAIVSDRAGIVERYPRNLEKLILSTPDSVDGLATQIVATLDNLNQIRTEVRQFGEKLRARSWDNMAADIVSLVETHYTRPSNPDFQLAVPPHILDSCNSRTTNKNRTRRTIHE